MNSRRPVWLPTPKISEVTPKFGMMCHVLLKFVVWDDIEKVNQRPEGLD